MKVGTIILFVLKVLFIVILVVAGIYNYCKSDQPEEA